MPSFPAPADHVAPRLHPPGRRSIALVLVLLLTAMPSSLSASEGVASQPIVGGTDAAPGEWPWQAAFVYTGPGSDYDNQFCGGSLINSLWVVTAAHCMFDESGELTTDDFAIIVGRTNLLDNDGETLVPMSIFIHEDYDNDLDGGSDIALIKLATPSSGTPVTLPRNPDAPYLAPGQVAIATGWGSTAGYAPGIEDPSVAFLPTLQEVEEPLRADADCAEWYGPIYDDATMLCAGGSTEGGTGSCQGDSGGPLVVFDTLSQSWMLAGITSFGDGCAAATVPAVYIEVAGVLQFIESHTGPLLADTTPQAYLPLLTRD